MATTSWASTAPRARRSAWCRRSCTPTCSRSVWGTVRFSRGLFGRSPDAAHLENVLRDLSLWDKRNDKIMTLSGGMKRRVLIAKALAHEPEILFLDEPTAGVDVELRRDMWALVRRLRERGVTIILTTHYIDEAEEMADRIGVINKGELVVVEEKAALMRKLGKKQLTLHLQEPMTAIPPGLREWDLALKNDGADLEYTFLAQRRACRHPGADATNRRAGHRLQGPEHPSELARGYLRRPGERARMSKATAVSAFNRYGVLRSTVSRWRARAARCGRAW